MLHCLRRDHQRVSVHSVRVSHAGDFAAERLFGEGVFQMVLPQKKYAFSAVFSFNALVSAAGDFIRSVLFVCGCGYRQSGLRPAVRRRMRALFIRFAPRLKSSAPSHGAFRKACRMHVSDHGLRRIRGLRRVRLRRGGNRRRACLSVPFCPRYALSSADARAVRIVVRTHEGV